MSSLGALRRATALLCCQAMDFFSRKMPGNELKNAGDEEECASSYSIVSRFPTLHHEMNIVVRNCTLDVWNLYITNKPSDKQPASVNIKPRGRFLLPVAWSTPQALMSKTDTPIAIPALSLLVSVPL